MADIEPRPASSVLTSEDTELVDLEDCLSENEEDIEDALSIVEVCGTLAENAELEVLNYRNSMHLSDNGISEESAVKSLKVTFKLGEVHDTDFIYCSVCISSRNKSFLLTVVCHALLFCVHSHAWSYFCAY